MPDIQLFVFDTVSPLLSLVGHFISDVFPLLGSGAEQPIYLLVVVIVSIIAPVTAADTDCRNSIQADRDTDCAELQRANKAV